MQNTRFLVLTGHLNDYPLGDLIGILRHQRKTGRLLIEYSNGPASLFFNEGELVDAQLGELSGLQAICVAVGQPPANFNFNPLVRPSNRSIEKSLQRVISELLGCWDENGLQVDLGAQETGFIEATPSPAAAAVAIDAPKIAPLALPGIVASDVVGHRSWSMLGGIGAGLLVLGLSTGIAVTGEFGSKASSLPLLPPSTANESVALPAAENRQAVARSGLSNVVAGRRGIQGEQVKTRSASENSRTKEVRVPNNSSVPVAERSKPDSREGTGSPSGPQKEHNDRHAPSVRVVMQIENGRVLKASVANHRPGMEAYEAMALRIARQRRYPATKAGQESVTINVQQ